MFFFLTLTIKNLTFNFSLYRSVKGAPFVLPSAIYSYWLCFSSIPSRKPSQKTVTSQQTTCDPCVPCLAYYETAINTPAAERDGDSCRRSACLQTEMRVRISAEGLKILPFAAACRINLSPVNSWYHSRFRIDKHIGVWGLTPRAHNSRHRTYTNQLKIYGLYVQTCQPFKDWISSKYIDIYKPSPYLTGNTIHLRYRDNRLILLGKQSLFIVRIIRNT
jgi:hypothetical protein